MHDSIFRPYISQDLDDKLKLEDQKSKRKSETKTERMEIGCHIKANNLLIFDAGNSPPVFVKTNCCQEISENNNLGMALYVILCMCSCTHVLE